MRLRKQIVLVMTYKETTLPRILRSTVSATYTGTVPPSRPTPIPSITLAAIIIAIGMLVELDDNMACDLTKVDGPGFESSSNGI
jgi:hypothetical protein